MGDWMSSFILKEISVNSNEPTFHVHIQSGPQESLDLGDLAEGWVINLKTGRPAVVPADPHVFESFLRVIYSTLLLEEGGFLLHGCAVVRGDGAVVGSGISGSGKSTLSGFAEIGTVLTDELVAVRRVDKKDIPSPLMGEGGVRVGGVWQAFATPFWGTLTPQTPVRISSPISVLAFLHKSSSSSVKRLSYGESLKRIMGNVVLYQQDSELADHALEACASFVDEVPCVEWEFPKKPSAWVEFESRWHE